MVCHWFNVGVGSPVATIGIEFPDYGKYGNRLDVITLFLLLIYSSSLTTSLFRGEQRETAYFCLCRMCLNEGVVKTVGTKNFFLILSKT